MCNAVKDTIDMGNFYGFRFIQELNPEKCKIVLQHFKVPKYIKNCSEFNIGLLRVLEPELCEVACESLKGVLGTMITRSSDVRDLLKELSPQSRLKVCSVMGEHPVVKAYSQRRFHFHKGLEQEFPEGIPDRSCACTLL